VFSYGNFNAISSLEDFWTNDANPLTSLLFGAFSLAITMGIVVALKGLWIAIELEKKGINMQGEIFDQWVE